jgi:hypothetical protein
MTAVRTGRLPIDDAGAEFTEMLGRAAEAKAWNDGAFDVHLTGHLDPSGQVKGSGAERAGERLAGLG